jgi:dTDP-4-dehydrorhamnose reductase
LMKLMIFGGSGFVGGNLTAAAQRKGWMVTIADNFFRPGLTDVEWLSVDITDKAAVKDAVLAVKPDAVVNVAAIADIDKAEQDRELARAVNVEGAVNVAEACRLANARYVFFSSDAVYDGKGPCYTEDDMPCPVNFYGQTKAEAEKGVLAACPGAAVIRISLVLGMPLTGGNSFVGALQSKLASGADVPCPIDEIRTPVDVHTLCEAVLELAGNHFSGILHIGCTESVDRYSLTRRLTGLLGYDVTLVKAKQPGNEGTGRAARHKNGIISVKKAQGILKTAMLNLDETMRRAVKISMKN